MYCYILAPIYPLPLDPYLSADSGLLQKVLFYLGPLDGPSLVKVNVDVFPKATGVVVPNSLSVPECCMDERIKVDAVQ